MPYMELLVPKLDQHAPYARLLSISGKGDATMKCFIFDLGMVNDILGI